ncbi:NAD-dependent epimerase/dehydratase family protein [Lepagella muris]|jgi:UDP-glucose 4-epimerase|uniref:SDR family oxidoreductase n=1 Tax=Lepagella muris TaxID=3032870 RepID=A0AC61RFF9_9BACT|nr:SDR family oxidoreductase [Lepagella muris]ROT04762.1 SDR family oxidoreductase [Muribaculaceae bacterium Isolate-037 (Harlan)]TGY79469.1 SDR family oxidoreductase [Lepagella muris]THG52939.1 SDR family oxidoreductase [Bacteroidales bacterium]TKC61859.1 SDR family oxidoreductase [Bacteroidales bacterium]
MEEKKDILITGASGMLGRYLKEIFGSDPDYRVFTLGRGEDNDFRCNLKTGAPDFGSQSFDIVVHCAGSEENDYDNAKLNVDGTVNLMDALDSHPPRYMVYISSWQVYGAEEGTEITEGQPIIPESPTGLSKKGAETKCETFASRHQTCLTIIRPARMFGNGVGGETLRMFRDAVNGRYIHICGNDARLSIVTAYDVARAIKEVYTIGGIYNASDGKSPRLVDLMEAMTANAGKQKRITCLTPDWAEWIWRLGRFIPVINQNLNPKVVTERMKTLTFDGSKLIEKSGITFHNTLDVISRTDPTYPYSEK